MKTRELLHLIGDGTLAYLGSESEIWRRFTQGHGLLQKEHATSKVSVLKFSQIKLAKDHLWLEPSLAFAPVVKLFLHKVFVYLQRELYSIVVKNLSFGGRNTWH